MRKPKFRQCQLIGKNEHCPPIRVAFRVIGTEPSVRVHLNWRVP